MLPTGAEQCVGMVAGGTYSLMLVATLSSTSRRLLQAGAAHVIATDEEDVLKEVRALTGDTGVTLAVDSVGGAEVNTVISAVAPGGTMVVYGALDLSPTPFPMAADGRGRHIHWYYFAELTVYQPQQLRRAEQFINAGLRSGSLSPVIDRTFDLDAVVQAHQYLESNDQVGKVVLTVRH